MGWESVVRLDIIVPVIMCCALLWWVGRSLNATRLALAAAVTLAVIVGVLWFERGFN